MKILQSALLQIVLLVGTFSSLVACAQTPILIIPGLTGSQLWGTVSRNGTSCTSTAERHLWYSPLTHDCIFNLELQFDETSGVYSDLNGVNVSVPGFGDTFSVECLADSELICATIPDLKYFQDFVEYFVARGYRRGVNLRAAPYDWRLAADSLATRGYFNNLKGLIETMYRETGQSVAMVIHSMGGPMSLYFLNEVVTQEWKNRYIKVYIPLSGAWGGSSETVGALLAETPISFYRHVRFGFERSLQSVYWLMPRAAAFADQTLVQTPTTNYTANDYQQMFTDFANYPLGWTKYMPTSFINEGYSYPQVPTYCFYGSNVPTNLTWVYSSNDTSSVPTVITGLGDGTANQASLEMCLNWTASTNSSGFQSRAFPGVDHIDMVKNIQVLNAIGEIVQAGPPTGSATTAGSISVMFLLAIALMSAVVV